MRQEGNPQSPRIGQDVISTLVGEEVRAYLPPPLPPNPPIDMARLYGKLEQANQALGRLDGVTLILPDTPLFLYMYVQKEALLSSQIEGTQSSFSDLLLFESNQIPTVPLDDVKEVSNYVSAMTAGVEMVRDGFPLSTRLFRELHSVLLRSGRGSKKEPGEFRRSQNWIGGTRPGNAIFVPPPPDHVADCMGELEKYLNNNQATLPLLIRAGLAHVQFETIHPFLDGNGRLGRLLISLMLLTEGALKEPILYLSLYLKTHRQTYYDLLQRVRREGAWEEWLEFFLTGVIETSEQATETAQLILRLFEQDRERIDKLGRAAASALRVHDHIQRSPVLRVPEATKTLSLSAPTVRKAVGHLVDLGVLREISGRKRGRVYLYSEYLRIIADGTEPIPNR